MSGLTGTSFLLVYAEALVDQVEKIVGLNPEVMRLNDCLVDFFNEHFSPHVFSQWRLAFLEETTLARDGFDNAEVFQLGIRLSDRVSIHAQFLRQRPDARQCFSQFQCARCRSGLDLIDHLQINGLAGFEIDLDEHCASVL